MKFRCGQKDLLDAFGLAATVIASKGPRPGPQDLLIEVKADGQAILHATDMEASLTKTWKPDKMEVTEPGIATVNAAKAVSILKEIPDALVNFETVENKVVISSRKSRFDVPTKAPEEYPPIPAAPADGGVPLPVELFLEMVKKCAFATALEKVHYSLNGVFLEIEKGTVRMVGTDGRRLAVFARKVKGLKGPEMKGIVPNKGIRLFEKLCSGLEGEITLVLVRNQLFFKAGGIEASTLLIEGTYPDYTRVIPKENDKPLDIAVSDLLAGLRQASVMAGDEAKIVRFNLEKDLLILHGESMGAGEAKVEVPAIFAYEGISLQFNPFFFIDFLRNIEEERVSILLKDNETAAVIKVGQEYTYVVMPLVPR